METTVKRRKKIFILFILGVALPSLLLGYFAFRGIQNDQALLEKQKLNDHRSTAEVIAEFVDQSISKAEQELAKVLSNHSSDAEEPALVQSIKDLKVRIPLVEEVFLFQAPDTIHMPVAELLYRLDSKTQNASVSSYDFPFMARLSHAQRLEFQEKNYPEALVSYQAVMDSAEDKRHKAECLCAIARVQRKADLQQEALSSFQKIARDFGQENGEAAIPLGLAARLEIGALYKEADNSLHAVKTFLELYDLMIHGEWVLERAQYAFFTQSVKKQLEDAFSHGSISVELPPLPERYQDLKDEEQNRAAKTERLLLFQASGAADVRAKLARDGSDTQNPAKRCRMEMGRDDFLFSLLPSDMEKNNGGQERWGFIINNAHLMDSLLRTALDSHKPSEKTSWMLKGSEGQTLLASENPPSGPLTIRSNFKGNFPNWILEFYQDESRLFETFLTSSRGIYFYMFLLITGILIFGSVLTIRAVGHELELARMKADFVSTVSHEFKSPLTSIRQIAEMLHAGRVPSDERRQKYYDVLLQQSERLSLLTENVLNFAKMEEGRKEYIFENTDIAPMIQDIVSVFQERIRHEGIEIDLTMEESLAPIHADRPALAQAVNNLIDNAVKYSGESKRVNVRAIVEERNLVLSVQDFGIGIKSDEIDKVFDRFFRGGDELTRTVKGSGLGLTLVKQIVNAHNGDVSLQSNMGQGSTFTIRIPIPEEEDTGNG